MMFLMYKCFGPNRDLYESAEVRSEASVDGAS